MGKPFHTHAVVIANVPDPLPSFFTVNTADVAVLGSRFETVPPLGVWTETPATVGPLTAMSILPLSITAGDEPLSVAMSTTRPVEALDAVWYVTLTFAVVPDPIATDDGDGALHET